MRLVIWSARIMLSLVLGGSFYQMVFSKSVGEFFTWLLIAVIGGGVGILWLIYLEQIQKEESEPTHPRPLDD